MKNKGQISKNLKPKPMLVKQAKILYQIIISTSDDNNSSVMNFYQSMNFIVLRHIAETLFKTYPNAVKVLLLDGGWNVFQMEAK